MVNKKKEYEFTFITYLKYKKMNTFFLYLNHKSAGDGIRTREGLPH